ncbi:MAG: RHS repeat-associated core domain-containing protein [Paucimonas sp.]|jgi:RHS repeat-associated protein|nr:RHS repeat-associated core domain-containing protein [Paucimonas sp.]
MPTSLADRIDRNVPDTGGVAFNGQLLESWGCYLLGNGYRAYSPVLARFHSPDRWSPFERGGLNGYAYCSGDPLNRVDPSGRWEERVGPLLALTLNVGLFTVAAYGIRSSAPAMQSGPALHATLLSGAGALVGIYGAVEQLLGNEEGKYISYVGTALSSMAAWRRVSIAMKADRKQQHNQKVKKLDDNLQAAAEIQYSPPSSQPTSPVSTRSLSAPPPSSAAASAARRSLTPSRSPTTSPVSSQSRQTRVTRSPSAVSSASVYSEQSRLGDLPQIATNIRLERSLSETSTRAAMAAMS